MQSLRVLDRFLPSEAYLLTLLGAHHVEMIREEQLLNYLDRGMGIANRDARTALLESALLRANEIEELDHFLERKVERGPREFRAICRSMFTPSVERVLRATHNADARRLTLDSPAGTLVAPAGSSGGNGSGATVGTDWDDNPYERPKAQTHPWIKAAVALGLLLLVALAAVMPMDKDQPAAANQQGFVAADGEGLVPHQNDMTALVRILYLVLKDQDAVVAHLKKEPCLTDKQRKGALSIALDDFRVAEYLNNASWDVVRCKDGSPTGYQRSFELAEEAYRLAPNDGMILNTVGVAQYRLGHYPEALKVLNQSYALNKKNPRLGELPADVAFLAMCYARLGRLEEAKAEIATLEQLMKSPFTASDRLEGEAFTKEAADVMQQVHANAGE